MADKRILTVEFPDGEKLNFQEVDITPAICTADECIPECDGRHEPPKHPTAPDTLEFELDWSYGCPRYLDTQWAFPYDKEWHGFVKDGIAYTRLGFRYAEYVNCLLSWEVDECDSTKATHIVFKRTDKLS